MLAGYTGNQISSKGIGQNDRAGGLFPNRIPAPLYNGIGEGGEFYSFLQFVLLRGSLDKWN